MTFLPCLWGFSLLLCIARHGFVCPPRAAVPSPALSGPASAALSDARIIDVALKQAVREVGAQTVMPDGERMAVTGKTERETGVPSDIDPRNIRNAARWLLWGSLPSCSA